MTLPVFRLPMPAKRFMADYWQKRALLMRKAAAGLEHPEPSLLAALALDETVESRLVRGGDNTPWSLDQGPFSEEDFRTLPDSDWTLLVQSVDCYLTEVSLLLDSFSFLPGWRLEDIMISYAAPGGGVGPHFDQYDVFLVQARGQRRWRLGPVCDDSVALREDAPLRLLREMPVSQEMTLAPGDVLYVPPGMAHWGTAEDDDCVTWSVGLRMPDTAMVIESMATEALSMAQNGPIPDPGRRTTRQPGRLSAGDERRLTAPARELLSDTMVQKNAVGRILSQPRQESLDFEPDLAHIRARAPQYALVRHGGVRLFLQTAGQEHRLWLNGDCRPLAASELPLARLVSHRRLISRRALEGALTPGGEALLEEWIHDGYFARL
jgi:50S ribosomal protein L16 3-hydroxylase